MEAGGVAQQRVSRKMRPQACADLEEPVRPSAQIRASLLCFFGITLAILVLAGAHVPHGVAGAAVGVLSGACFLVVGSVLRFLDVAAGDVAIKRVTETRQNWQTDTLRSFIEAGCFLNVIFQAYNLTDNIVFAVVVGTLAGVFMVLCGEWFKHLLQTVETQLRTSTGTESVFKNDAFAFVYVGCVTVATFVCHHMTLARDVGTALALATATGVAFVTATQLFITWRPTRSFGQLLQRRILHTGQNWHDRPVRSGMELGFFLGFIYGSYALSNGSVAASMVVGTLAGILVCLISHLAMGRIAIGGTPYATSKDTSLTPLCLFGWFGFALMYAIYEYQRNFVQATLLGVTTGIALTIAAQAFTLWTPTAKLGVVLQQRVIGDPTRNWRAHPWRSFFETGVFTTVLACTLLFYGSFLMAVQMGTATGIMTVLFNEFDNIYPAGNGRCCGTGPVSAGYVSGSDDDAAAASTQKASGGSNGKRGRSKSGLSSGPTIRFECHRDVVERSVAEKRGNERFAMRVARTVTWEELAAHTFDPTSATVGQEGGSAAWIAVHGYVYDITRWIARHPGGAEVLGKFAGADATDQFDAFHQPETAARLQHFLVGTLQPPPTTTTTTTTKATKATTKTTTKTKEKETGETVTSSAGAGAELQSATPEVLAVTAEYRALRERMWREGWFQADLMYFVQRDLVMLAFAVAGVLLLCLGSGSTRAVVGSAMLLGLGVQQAAFVAHDALHNGVLKPPRGGGFNLLGWLHGSVIFGISADMWLVEHSLHHAITRRPCEDPQFNYLPLWLISPKEVAKGNKFAFKVDFVTRQLVKVQHITMLPLAMVFGRFNLHAISIVYAVRNGKLLDLLGMVAYFTWFGWLVAQVPGTAEQFGGNPAGYTWPWLRIMFVFVCYITIGVLHVQLLVNHMDVEAMTEEEEREQQFFAFQCLTTRNTDTDWWDGWYHGGLQYQIEHHLFPQLPRHRLHLVQPLVKDLCARHGVPYRSSWFSTATLNCLKDLRALSTHLMTMDVADLG